MPALSERRHWVRHSKGRAAGKQPETLNWEERWDGAVLQGAGAGAQGSLSGSSSCYCTPGHGLSSPGCDFTASTSLPLQATADFAGA